ncbi:MAG: NAD-dependent epimerase/dehydratase family protein [Thalassobaculaceae bacterium]|nr:NAD-dependent epimerase/dehydratase family protein [Thalassobaculaceae bacterium]
MSNNSILITGGSGRLGHFVVEAMLPDHTVEVLDVSAPSQDVLYREVDMRDIAAVRSAVRGHERIIHLAAIDDGVDVPDHTYFEVNVQGTWNLLRAAEEEGVGKVVLASSAASYGFAKDAPPDYLPIDEAHPQRPRRTYDLTKLLVERAAESFARRHAQSGSGIASIVCLRPTLVARPVKTPQMLAELTTLAAEDGNPGIAIDAPIYGGLPLMRNYVTSRDAAAAFRAAVVADTAPFAVYLIAARDSMGSVDTLDFLSRAHGWHPTIQDESWFRRVAASPFDTRAAERDLGWVAQDDWKSVVSSHVGPDS